VSNLGYQTVPELKESKTACEKYIKNLKSSLAGQNERLKWIDKYLFEKTVQELTIYEIEHKLGHKIIIKE